VIADILKGAFSIQKPDLNQKTANKMKKDKKLIMVRISGRDRPGITAKLSRILVDHRVDILDIEQASLQKMLGLYFLLDLKNASVSEDGVIKDLLFEANKLGLDLRFQLLQQNEVQEIHQRNLFVLTHFGDTRALAEFSEILARERVNIETISSLHHHGAQTIEMVLNVDEVHDLGRMKRNIMAKSRELQIDLGLQKMEAFRKNKRLIFFDMDSTLIDMEIIDELARKAGVYREVSRITEKAMRGDFDFDESLIQRVALLKGLTLEDLHGVKNDLRLSQGVEELLVTLKWLGYKLGIVTGGFDFFADFMKERLGFDFAYSNRLEIKRGVLSGKVLGKIIDAPEKAHIVNDTACDLGIPLDQVVVVGDGANDSLMLGQAGLGIAYNAKKGLDKVAQASLGRTRLSHIFHLLGITEEDIKDAMSCNPA
jgi:phosphoserine phosphatase